MQKLESTDRPRWPLFVAPHRAMFLAGTILLLAGFGLWKLELAARAGLWPSLPWILPPGWLHGLILASGVFPLYMFGFLLTAMPRWQGMPDLIPSQWLRAWGLLVCGWLLVLCGAFFKPLLLIGLVLLALGWGVLLRLLWVIARAPVNDPSHAMLTFAGMFIGWVCVLLWLLALLFGQFHWLRPALQLTVWWSLLPVFMAVSHRMIPFFTSSVSPGYVMYRPAWALWLIVAAGIAHGGLSAAGLPHWTWVTDVPGAAGALLLSSRWMRGARVQVRLLGMLHIGFAWLGIGLLLSGVQSFAAFAGFQHAGHTALHIILTAYFGSMLLAMVSRVTLGHSGRPLQADASTWVLMLGLQGVVLLRVTADFAPGMLNPVLMLLAGLAWWGGFAWWAWRYLPIYWRPRLDGKPG